MTEPPSWNDLDRRKSPTVAVDIGFEEVCARIFITPDGKQLLAELRKRHFDTGGNELADDRALRVRIAKQQFVRDLETACERGLAARTKPKDK